MLKIKAERMGELEKMGFTTSKTIPNGIVLNYDRTKFIDRGEYRRCTYQRVSVAPITGRIRFYNMHSEVFNKTCWIKDLIKADMVEVCDD